MEQLILTYITVFAATLVAAYKAFNYFKDLNKTDCGACSSDCSMCALGKIEIRE